MARRGLERVEPPKGGQQALAWLVCGLPVLMGFVLPVAWLVRLLWRETGLKEVFVTAYGESAKTFPARFPMLALDRIYVRNAFVHLPVVLPRRPWSHLSDHAPLAAEIHL